MATRFFPCSLARYSAASARSISASGVPASGTDDGHAGGQAGAADRVRA